MSARRLGLVCALCLGAVSAAGCLELSGSVAGSVGYVALRATVFSPDAVATLPDYAASTAARISVEAGERSRLSFEGRCRLDAVDQSVAFDVLRAYAEARIGDLVSFGLGRRLVGFGCGLVWNPCNGLDTPRDAFDRSASRPGLDAAFAALDLGSVTGFPLSLSLQAVAPPFTAGADIAKATVAAQAYVYVGGVELGVVGDCADPAGERPRWSVGAWGTVDLAGLILGMEIAWRKTDGAMRPDDAGLPVADDEPHLSALASLSLRCGDFFLYAEGLYSGAALSTSEAALVSSAPAASLAAYAYVARPGSIGRWHVASGAEWSREPVSCGLGALVDIEEAALAVYATASLAIDGAATIRLKGTVPIRSGTVSEYDFLSFRWATSLSVEVFF